MNSWRRSSTALLLTVHPSRSNISVARNSPSVVHLFGLHLSSATPETRPTEQTNVWIYRLKLGLDQPNKPSFGPTDQTTNQTNQKREIQSANAITQLQKREKTTGHATIPLQRSQKNCKCHKTNTKEWKHKGSGHQQMLTMKQTITTDYDNKLIQCRMRIAWA